MPIQTLPARSRCGVAFALLLLPLGACGQEREPWYGFELFPARQQLPDGTAGMDATDAATATDVGGSPAAELGTSSTSVGIGSPGAPPAANSGTTPTGPEAAAGETAAPSAANAPDGAGTVQAMMPLGPPTAFRITELQLRDPHVFAGTQDLTEQEVLGQSVNLTLIPAKLTKDGDGDGLIDVSVIALLQPFDPTAAPDKSPMLTFVNADCPANGGANAACKPQSGQKGLETTWTLEQRTTGNCLEPIANTTSAYTPAVTLPTGPCFVTTGGNDLTMDLGGIKIKVTAARVAASYQSQPPSLVRGLLAGFVTRTAAMQAIVPSAAGPAVAGDPLSTYIRQRDYDMAASPNGQDGFWMYLNFVAKPITYAK